MDLHDSGRRIAARIAAFDLSSGARTTRFVHTRAKNLTIDPHSARSQQLVTMRSESEQALLGYAVLKKPTPSEELVMRYALTLSSSSWTSQITSGTVRQIWQENLAKSYP